MASQDLTQRDIIQYLKRCRRKSAKGEIGLLSLAYVGWIEEDRLAFNPCFGVKIKLPKSRRDRLLSDSEIDAIIAKADERLAVAIELAYALGLRISDLCALRWSDLQTNVKTQKTGARQAYDGIESIEGLLARGPYRPV